MFSDLFFDGPLYSLSFSGVCLAQSDICAYFSRFSINFCWFGRVLNTLKTKTGVVDAVVVAVVIIVDIHIGLHFN